MTDAEKLEEVKEILEGELSSLRALTHRSLGEYARQSLVIVIVEGLYKKIQREVLDK